MTDAILNARNGASTHNVSAKKVRGADGKSKTMRFVDLDSPTLTNDLLYVFRKNVEKARRENKRVTGSADGLRPPK